MENLPLNTDISVGADSVKSQVTKILNCVYRAPINVIPTPISRNTIQIVNIYVFLDKYFERKKTTLQYTANKRNLQKI